MPTGGLVLQVQRYCEKSMISRKVRLLFPGAWVESSGTLISIVFTGEHPYRVGEGLPGCLVLGWREGGC